VVFPVGLNGKLPAGNGRRDGMKRGGVNRRKTGGFPPENGRPSGRDDADSDVEEVVVASSFHGTKTKETKKGTRKETKKGTKTGTT
jgi:hypothetical protein